MKKNPTVFLLFLFSFGYAQIYNFDFLTKYAHTDLAKKTIWETVSYHNTDDFTYYLSLTKLKTDFTATLYDQQRNLAHEFSVQQTGVKDAIHFQFTYLYTSQFHVKSRFKNYRYEVSEISTSPKIVSLKVYDAARAKKPLNETELTLKKASKNLVPLYRSDAMQFYGAQLDLSSIGNYIVSKTVEKFKTVTLEAELKEYKNVDLTIVLPTKLVL